MRPFQCGGQLCLASGRPHFQDFLSPHVRHAKIGKHAGALSTAVAVVVSSVLQRHDVAKVWGEKLVARAGLQKG